MDRFAHMRTSSRRQFLVQSAQAIGATMGAGALLEACNTSSNPSSSNSSAKTTLTVMYSSGEFTPAYVTQFQKLHPDIKIKFVEYDATRLSAMLAAGQPPDFVRTSGAPVMPNLIARGIVADLTSYFDKSSVLKVDNLGQVNEVYRWDGKSQGQGPRYGMAKDWSQDAMMWYDKRVFDAAHVPYPSETKPLAYDELLDLGKRLTVRQNGKIKTYGLNAEWGFFTQGHLIQMVAQQGGSLYNSDLTKIDLTTPEARKAVTWYIDWAKARIGPSPLDPDAGWDGTLMPAKRLGISMFGYWFGGQVSADTQGLGDHVGFLPAPVMGPNRISACMSGTGAWIPQASKNKDAAWTLMEYFMAGQPAKDRATSGWGIPSLKSLVPDMPQTKPYQKLAYQAQQAEFSYLKILTFTPYISDDAFTTAFAKAMEPVMHGQRSLDDGIKAANDSINGLLQQGKQQVS